MAAINAKEIIKAFYDALIRGDVPGALALLSPEVEWTEAERFPYYSGTWRSPNEVLEKLLIPIMRDWDGFTPRVDEFVSEGERVASVGRYLGVNKQTGRSMKAPFVHLWTVRNGLAVKFDMIVDSVFVLEAMPCKADGAARQ